MFVDFERVLGVIVCLIVGTVRLAVVNALSLAILVLSLIGFDRGSYFRMANDVILFIILFIKVVY